MAGSKLLINEHPLQVLPSLASSIGLNEAIVLQQVHYWLSTSKHTHDGRKWIFNSYEDWKKQFPFWSVPTIQRTIYSLEKKGLLLSGIFNQLPKDRTKWYTVNYDKLAELETVLPSHQIDEMGGNQAIPSHQIDDTISSNCEDASHQIDMMLPETTTETTTETNNTYKAQAPENIVSFKKGHNPLNAEATEFRRLWDMHYDAECKTPGQRWIETHTAMYGMKKLAVAMYKSGGKSNQNYIVAIARGLTDKDLEAYTDDGYPKPKPAATARLDGRSTFATGGNRTATTSKSEFERLRALPVEQQPNGGRWFANT